MKGLTALVGLGLVVGSATIAGAGGAPQPTEPTVSISDNDLAHIREVRAQFGLRSDRTYVLELESREGAIRTAETGYLSLTPEEAEVVQLYQDLTSDFSRHSGHLIERAGDAWAGARLVVGDAGPVVEVFVTDDSFTRGFDVSSAAPHFPGRVILRPAEYSEAELERAVPDVANLLRRQGIPNQGVRVATSRNRVEVLVDPSVSAKVAGLLDSHPHVEVVIGEAPAEGTGLVDTLLKDQLPGYNLMFAGLAIGPTSDEICTSGFAVQNGYGPFILTAAHCTNMAVGQNWYQGGSRFGTLAAWTDRADGKDAALITTYGHRPTRGRVHRTQTYWYEAVTFMPSYVAHGSYVCHSGFQTTGLNGMSGVSQRCGHVTSTCSDPPYSNVYAGCYIEADYGSAPGDSGSAVWQETGYGHGAFGLTSTCVGAGGACTTPYRAFFTSLPRLANIWGLTLTTWQ